MARKAAVEERPALTRERIVAAASDLIERDGIGAFTMRSLVGSWRVGHGRLQPLRFPGCHSRGRASAG